MVMRIIFNNVKGGCGKTMTTFQLSATLSDRGYKVLCVDLDPQGSLTRALLGSRPETGIFEFITGENKFDEILKQPYPDNEKLKNIYLLPTTYDMFYFKEGKDNNYTPLDFKRAMKDYDKDYDFVLVDTNPSLMLTTLNALAYGDYIFGVMDACLDAIDGFNYLNEGVVSAYRTGLKKKLEIIGILLNESDRRKRLSGQMQDIMKNTFKDLMFETVISNAVAIEESRASSLPIIEYDPTGAATDKYVQLTIELLRRLKVGA